jgi:hypothetical protein
MDNPLNAEERAARTAEHNRKLMEAFETEAQKKGCKYPAAAIVIGASSGRHFHVACDQGLPPDALIDLLVYTAEGIRAASIIGARRKERTC